MLSPLFLSNRIPLKLSTLLIILGLGGGIFTLIFPVETAQAADGLTGLVGYWKFDEGSGLTTGNDITGKPNGRLVNGPLWVGGIAGKALSFNSAGSRVTITSSGEGVNYIKTITASAWIYPLSGGSSTSRRFILRKTSVSLPARFIIYLSDDGNLKFEAGYSYRRGRWSTTAHPVAFNAWNHIAVTYTFGNTALDPIIYVNGSPQTLQKELSPQGTPAADDKYLYVGDNGNGRGLFYGLIDEVRIYKRILSADDISTVYYNDFLPPQISSVAASAVDTWATVTWTTDEPASSQVEYGAGAAYGSSSALDANLTTYHSVILSGLKAETAYHFRVKSRDAAANLTVSNDSTFTTLAPTYTPQTYQKGSVVYLDNGKVKVGLELAWGGVITAFVMNGANFINRYDVGREIQFSFYDGNQKYTLNSEGSEWGWNPVQGGDQYQHGSPVLTKILGNDFIYTKTQPYEWHPDDKGGEPGKPVLTDIYIEQWVSFVENNPSAVKLHYKITHFGEDTHANSSQEIPAGYVNIGYDYVVRYDGISPWTGGSVSYSPIPVDATNYYTAEKWESLVNGQNVGLTVFIPGQYPYTLAFRVRGTTGPTGTGANYFAPRSFFTFYPHSTLEGDVYLIGGNLNQARQIIYQLKSNLPPVDIFPPFGKVDSPGPAQLLSGIFKIEGWAFDDTGVAKVEIFVDDILAGKAAYGLPRPDVGMQGTRYSWPHAPVNIGFSYYLNTALYSPGSHVIKIKATDTSGHVATFPDIPVQIGN